MKLQGKRDVPSGWKISIRIRFVLTSPTVSSGHVKRATDDACRQRFMTALPDSPRSARSLWAGDLENREKYWDQFLPSMLALADEQRRCIMNGLSILGLLLIILGIVGLVVGGVTYTKDKDTTELGPIDITVKEKEHVHIPPALAVVSLIGGALLVVAGSRRRSV